MCFLPVGPVESSAAAQTAVTPLRVEKPESTVREPYILPVSAPLVLSGWTLAGNTEFQCGRPIVERSG